MTVTRSKHFPTPITSHHSYQPRMRQKHFPSRATAERLSTKPTTRRAVSSAQQSTLTQLQYVTSSFSTAHSDSEVEEVAFPQPAKKRRRMTRTKGPEDGPKQATLTQIGWPHTISGEEESTECEGEAHELAGEDEFPASHLKTRSSEAATKDICGQSVEATWPSDDKMDSQGKRKPHSPRVSRLLGPSQGALAEDAIWRGGTPIPKTPSKPIKLEVPSSQSPEATPIPESSSASKRQREALAEIPRNIWAQRDSTPSPRPREREADADDEPVLPDDEKENLELAEHGNASPFRKTVPRPSPRLTQGRPPGVARSADDLNLTDRYLRRVSLERSPSPSPCPRGQRETHSIHATTTKAGFELPRPFPAGPTRSSQATTVDLTQASPAVTSRMPRPASQQAPAEMAFTSDESQFPYSAFSVYTEDGDPEIPLGASLESQFSPLPSSSSESNV